MCKDIAPEQMEINLKWFDDNDKLLKEVDEALTRDPSRAVEFRDIRKFIDERGMMFEAMAGAMNDTHILITPYAELLRGTHGQ